MLSYPRHLGNYKPAGTRSFRAACSKHIDELGGNAQNPGEEFQEIAVADEGKILTQSDQSGAEALV